MRQTRSAETGELLMRVMRSRTVIRDYAPGAIPRSHLIMILQAGRLASSAGNNRVHRFLVTEDPRTIGLIRSVAPGMLAVPTAAIVICTDLAVAKGREVQASKDPAVWIDVGTSAMNMQLMAHALDLGSCPVTSFSQSGLSVMLALPPEARPELLLMIGRRQDRPPVDGITPPEEPSVDEFAYWESYG
jgi:albonoursin synthase